MVAWYKVLDKDYKAKDGGSFDYVPFVDGKKWTPEIKDLKLCGSGYHVTKYWNMFLTDSSNKIFEVKVKGLVEEEVLAGVCEKAVCSSLKIVKEFIPTYKADLNTGYRNTGNNNTGSWNTSDYHAGAFNTKEAEKVYLFNKEILKTEYYKIQFPKYFFFNLDSKNYKACWKKSFANATQEEKEATVKLPNFDFKVFKEITGITEKMLTSNGKQKHDTQDKIKKLQSRIKELEEKENFPKA